MTEFLLTVSDLKVHFPVTGGAIRRRIGTVHAVDGVSFSIASGKTLGLVGESGCGKTTTGRAVIGLLSPTSGVVRFDGVNLADATGKEMKIVRRNMQMIFQDPFESLNSRHTIAEILAEPFEIHRIGTPAEIKTRCATLLERVGLDPDMLNRYPHEFSGGQRQRIGIARALALGPRLIVADEPVSALDVSIQSQILNLLLTLQQDDHLSYLFIAHDLSVVKHISDHIAVMYLGTIVEYAEADALYHHPVHPYTRALIEAIPVPEPGKKQKRRILSGEIPSPAHPPSGCRFHTRCPHAAAICKTTVPKLSRINTTGETEPHLHACLRADEIS